MTASLLTQAVRLLKPLVDDSGAASSASLPEAARLLGLTAQPAAGVIETLRGAGFVDVKKGRVYPTEAGIALGVEAASALRQIHLRDLPARKVFWTYVPEEVDL